MLLPHQPRWGSRHDFCCSLTSPGGGTHTFCCSLAVGPSSPADGGQWEGGRALPRPALNPPTAGRQQAGRCRAHPQPAGDRCPASSWQGAAAPIPSRLATGGRPAAGRALSRPSQPAGGWRPASSRQGAAAPIPSPLATGGRRATGCRAPPMSCRRPAGGWQRAGPCCARPRPDGGGRLVRGMLRPAQPASGHLASNEQGAVVPCRALLLCPPLSGNPLFLLVLNCPRGET